MSCFKIPSVVCKRLTSMILGFWWRTDSQNRGIHLIKADRLFDEKEFGGLGFRKLKLMNEALLPKQGWRILSEPSLLVSRLLKPRYFPNDDLLNAEGGSRPSYGWRGIKEALEIIREGARWSALDNRYVWCGDSVGVYSVKGGYKVAARLEKAKKISGGEQSDSKEVRSFWKGLWRLDLPPESSYLDGGFTMTVSLR
ncbi:hypothetical protein QQ045_026344 [Rhodiola kirilowii]